MGSGKKGILLLPDFQGKGRVLKLSDKHGLGKTHLSILSGETSLGTGVLLLDVSDKMEIIDFLQAIIKQNCKKYHNYTRKMCNRC